MSTTKAQKLETLQAELDEMFSAQGDTEFMSDEWKEYTIKINDTMSEMRRIRENGRKS